MLRRLLRFLPSRSPLFATTALLCIAASLASPKPTHAQTNASARAARNTAWEQAERRREDIEARPPGTRTRAAYAGVMDGFRAVYHADPADLHAPASVYAVAELLAEEGRGLLAGHPVQAVRSLQAAVGQYEFLRTQYPGSSLRVAALLAEAQVEENDLHDEAAARERYRMLLKQYPHSEQAEEARAGLDSIASGRSRTATNPAADRTPLSGTTADNAAGAGDPVTPIPRKDSALPASSYKIAAVSSQGSAQLAQNSSPSGPAAQVKSIRHWSTPTYTRVAIDLGDNVTFEAARVPNPDRIYFDLHNTRLAPELIGKSFSVTDDGFLRKIRAAQFSGNMTRVVLDVNDVSEYSAFLLPNPYRLIIDIHGGSKVTTAAAVTASVEAASAGDLLTLSQTATPGTVAGSGSNTNRSSLPGTAPTSSSITPKPTPPVPRSGPVSTIVTQDVPNTIAIRAANSTDVASLSAQPGRVDATSRPTSQPISAVVAGTTAAANHSTRRTKTLLTDGAAVDEAPQARHAGSSAAGNGTALRSAGNALPARAATPTADGETSLTRALGLKIGRIVLDPGHGGHDSGTLGVDGIEEKDVVLDVALRLGKLLHDRLGAEIVYTRSDDTFVPLETRTAIANKAQADLFLSIHANSSSDESARGVETYYLNFTSSPDALETAARENAVSNQSIHQLSDLVRKITLRDKIDESREFASDVEQGLYTGLTRGNEGLKNRGVKKAPFVVLIGANMPSILAEISFVTNPRDAEQLQQPAYRQRVAESLYKGVARYASGLSGTKPSTLRASSGTK